tara:strand:- start:32153 stop:32479 length:327 start_codon:yes stop_codon:yes gene_type:complete
MTVIQEKSSERVEKFFRGRCVDDFRIKMSRVETPTHTLHCEDEYASPELLHGVQGWLAAKFAFDVSKHFGCPRKSGIKMAGDTSAFPPIDATTRIEFQQEVMSQAADD